MITFSDTTIVLGGKVIVENLNFTVGQGEFVCIIGASGCGKTTALRLAAGLYQPSGGKVTFDGKPMTAPRRDIAIIFQDYGKALLPWRTAAGNVSLALEAAGVPSAKRAPRIAELLDKVGSTRSCRQVPGGDVGWHAAAPADRAVPGAGSGGVVDGRAVRRARRHDPAGPAGRGAVAGRRQSARRYCS